MGLDRRADLLKCLPPFTRDGQRTKPRSRPIRVMVLGRRGRPRSDHKAKLVGRTTSIQGKKFDRAADFPSSRPQGAEAGARRACQGWPLLSGYRQARPLHDRARWQHWRARHTPAFHLLQVYPRLRAVVDVIDGGDARAKRSHRRAEKRAWEPPFPAGISPVLGCATQLPARVITFRCPRTLGLWPWPRQPRHQPWHLSQRLEPVRSAGIT
jgi:hypothetical protein